MGKTTITQRSFVLGELKEGFLEADDLEARANSVRGGLNMRITSERSISERYGTRHIINSETAVDEIELRPASGVRFRLVIGTDGLVVYDEANAIVFSEATAPWPSTLTAPDVWVEPFRETTVIGGAWGLYTLTYDDGTWSFDPFEFEEASGSEIAQPYWSFVKTSIIPSAVTGSITVTASAATFVPEHVGVRIRYNGREILITAYTSATVVTGTVIAELPPSYRLTVDNVKGFRVGDAILGADTDYQGIVVAIGVGTIDVTTLEFFGGPDVGEVVSCPTSSGNVTAKALISPLYSPRWDEALISEVRGYPRAGTSASGRLTFVDFPLVPDLIVMSSLRSTSDFAVGSRDDDAIVRQCGDNAPRFLHAINAGDLVLLSDAGLYYVEIRNGGVLTPSSFNAVLFDKRAASAVRPVLVEDGIVFVEASGTSIAAALLDGNIYLKWSVRPISLYHSHLIKNPIKLCGPSEFSIEPEKYLFVINDDGTVAAMSWFDRFSPETVGLLPWETEGRIQAVSPIFGTYSVLVERTVLDEFGDPESLLFIEEMDPDARLDCTVALADAIVYRGMTVQAYANNYNVGMVEVASDGSVPSIADLPSNTVLGLNFEARCQPWPVERVDTPYAGIKNSRLIRGAVSVLGSGVFKIRANNLTKEVGGYSFGDDLSEAPPDRTKVYRFSVTGRRDHPEIEFIRDTPSKMKIMAITQEVQF